MSEVHVYEFRFKGNAKVLFTIKAYSRAQAMREAERKHPELPVYNYLETGRLEIIPVLDKPPNVPSDVFAIKGEPCSGCGAGPERQRKLGSGEMTCTKCGSIWDSIDQVVDYLLNEGSGVAVCTDRLVEVISSTEARCSSGTRCIYN